MSKNKTAKKTFIILFFLFILFSNLNSKNLVWLFKVKGKSEWLKIGIPYIIYKNLDGQNYLAGYNYPQEGKEIVNLSEEVSYPYIINNARGLNMENLYTGKIEENDGFIKLELDILNIKKYTHEKIKLTADSIEKLINKIERDIFSKDSTDNSFQDINELKYLTLSYLHKNTKKINILKNGLIHYPNSKILREFYLKSLLEEEEHDTIIAFLENPKTIYEIRIKAYTLMKTDNYKNAEFLLEKIENKNSFDYMNLAICSDKNGALISKTEEYILKIVQTGNSSINWVFFYNFSLFNYKNKNYNKAKKHIIDSLKASFESPTQLTLLYKTMRNDPNSLSSFFNCFSPKNIFNNIVSYVSYYEYNNNLDYISLNPFFKKPVKNVSDRYYFNQAISSLKAKQLNMAKTLFRTELYSSPFNDKNYFFLAYSYLKTKNLNNALLNIETAILINEKIKYNLLKLYILKQMNKKNSEKKLYSLLKKSYPQSKDLDKIYNKKNVSWLIEEEIKSYN